MYSAFYRRTFAIATFLIVTYLLLEVLRPLAGPLGWAAVLAFLLTPVQVRLKRRLKGRGSLSAGILTGPLSRQTPAGGATPRHRRGSWALCARGRATTRR